jgi:hypothetical protein
MKRTPLRSRSKKVQEKDRMRAQVREQILTENPWCHRCLWERAVDVHELKRRSQGGNAYDAAECIGLCRACHDWCGAYPTQAHAAGFVIWSHEPVVKPPIGGR